MKRATIYGFIISAILGVFVAAIPADDVQSIIAKLETYYKTYPQVRVHLIFNQPKYAPGDTAFFKVFFLHEDFRPVPDKQIITLELKDANANNVQAQNIRVMDGEGYNQIIFSNNLPPGEYTLVAYSEVMKNLDPTLFFSKKFLITGRMQLMADNAKQDVLKFYPEGGYLVENTENNIVVKSNRMGSGKVIDQTGMLVADFQIGKEGISSFSFTPKEGYSYSGQFNGMETQIPLSTTEEACAVKVKRVGSGGVDIDLSVPPGSSLGRQELYFIVLSKGRVVYSSSFKLDNSKTTLSVNNLHPGLNEFFIFDKKDNLLAERIYYVAPSTAKVQITPEKNTVAPRDAVNISVGISDESGRSSSGSFVTRVLNTPLFSGIKQASFETEINLFNDLPGLRTDFEQSGLNEAEWMATLDERLISQKWARINWKEVFNPGKSQTKYPYKYSLDLKGRAIFKSTGEPVPDSTLIMIYQQKGMVGYQTYTSKKGEFVFPFIYDFTGTDQVFYMMEFRKKEKQQDYFIQPELAINTLNETRATESGNPDPYGDYKFRKKLIDRSFSFFADPNKSIDAKINNPNAEFEDELGGADVTVKVDDYLVFPTMPDLIHEVISGLQHRASSSGSTVRVVFIRNTYTVIPKGDPLYIIDGVLTKNTAFFLKLNPQDISSIKLINNETKLQRLGEMGKYGIVIVQTKKSIAKEVMENSTIFPVSGLSLEMDFKTPQYTNETNSRKPDLRSSIYWNPNFSTNANGRAELNFYASDDAAPATIEVMGFTSDGRAFSARQVIEVKAPEIRQ